ncbi:MAG TPA: SdiA-regulated domain-containing protein [Ferruginibacter sp.]|nr:SdiA-regulated domain-containing protein [Ferruginibacter sp.]
MRYPEKWLACLIGASLVMALSFCSGVGGKSRFPDTPMYNLSSPTIINLPEELDEISGIAYYPKDTSVFAIVDEEGFLFKIPIKNPPAFRKWRFDKKGDFEDLVLKDSVFYALVSNGDIESIHFSGDSIFTETTDFASGGKSTNEFESLYLDEKTNSLVLVCKECEADSKKTISMYAYGLADSIKSYRPFDVIDAVPIAVEMLKEKIHIKPSSIAMNPITNELYMLSSLHHALIILGEKGKFKKLYMLDPSIYKQAEGIAFTPAGDLLISNERAEIGFPTLLVIKNKLK